MEIRRLGKEIIKQVADIEKDTQESEQATTLRKKENKDFLVTQKDFSESIDALQRALKVLKTSDEKVSLSLVQLLAVRSLKNLPEDAMASIDAFLAQQQRQQPATALLDKASDTQAPQPHTYEFQSGSVVEMLEGLLDKFEDQRVGLRSRNPAFGSAGGSIPEGAGSEDRVQGEAVREPGSDEWRAAGAQEFEESLAESKAQREKEIADLKEALTMLNSMDVTEARSTDQSTNTT